MLNLEEIKEKYGAIVADRKRGGSTRQILVCGGSGCHSSGSAKIAQLFEKLIGKRKDISLVKTGCMGMCAKGPSAIVYPEEIFYVNINEQEAEKTAAADSGGGGNDGGPSFCSGGRGPGIRAVSDSLFHSGL